MNGEYCAPGSTESRASWTATTPRSPAGTGPSTVLTVGAWGAECRSAAGVAVMGTTFRERHGRWRSVIPITCPLD
ncbi:hypothetical protein ACFFX0_08330 [Citricoccus parietis]|uniref:Uncharacterized protein n=1 Tax=Citricoccus parietis TaxID=592307 RepID=A0ABV5FX39_9MICC